MIIESLYRLQIDTQVPFEDSDEEACQALVLAMQNTAALLGFKVLTYRLHAAKLMLLVSARSRGFPMSVYAAAEDKERGSGKVVLYEKLSRHLDEDGVLQMNRELNSLPKDEETDETDQNKIDVAVQRIARSIGNPQKFLQQIEWSFLKWVQENRPQLYPQPVDEDEDDLDVEDAEDTVLVTHLSSGDALADIAMEMDRGAVENDRGQQPRRYWSGYADALRKDHRALEGLKKLINKPDAETLQEIDYPTWLSQNAGNDVADVGETEQGLASLPESGVDGLADPASSLVPEMEDDEYPGNPGDGKNLLLALSFCIMIAVCAGAAYYVYTYKPVQQAPLQVNNEEVEQEEKKKMNPALVLDQLKGPEAVSLAEAFATSADPQERLKLCRYPDAISERLLTYPAAALDVPAEIVFPGTTIEFPGVTHRRFLARFADGSSRQLWVVATDYGLKVDWDSYARYNTASWPELLDGTKKVAELRVLANKRPYYNFEYRDEEKWLCCELMSSDYEGSLYGYVRRGTTAAKMLDKVMANPGKGPARAFTLRISSSGESYKNKQFTIDRVLALGWVRAEKDVQEYWENEQAEPANNEPQNEPAAVLPDTASG